MKTVCASGPVTKGIDIYHGDYLRDINQVLQSGVLWMYLKAWEYHEDPTFRARWDTCKSRMIIRGAYDFFHPGRDPIDQAEGFLSTFGGQLEETDLPCALDLEVVDDKDSKSVLSRALQWLQYVEAKTKKTPVLYTSPSFITFDDRFARYPLWIANYRVRCPHVPNPWPSWAFWQGSDKGVVPGMLGVCDTDQFNGDLDALKAFTRRTI